MTTALKKYTLNDIVYENPFISEFLKLVRTIIPNRDVSQNQTQNGKQCSSWWDGSLCAILSGSTLFAKQNVLVCEAEMFKVRTLKPIEILYVLL